MCAALSVIKMVTRVDGGRVTPEAELAVQLLPRVRELVQEAGTALQRAYRVLDDGALIGPAGSALYDRLADRQHELRRASLTLFDRVEDLARQAPTFSGTPWPHVPRAPIPSGRKASTRSGSPDGLKALIDELHRTAGTWAHISGFLGSYLRSLNLGASPAHRIGHLASNLRTEIPDLRRRCDLFLREDQNPFESAAWQAVAHGLTQALRLSNPTLHRRTENAGIALGDLPYNDPAAARDWWQHLTPRQRDLVTRAYPTAIGWTNGLPAQARDKANRLALRTRLDILRNIGAARRSAFEQRDYGRLSAVLGEIERVSERLNQPILLLGFDSTTVGPWDPYRSNALLGPNLFKGMEDGPDGRLILSVGDPDVARHVGVYIPGTTAQLDKIGGDLARVANIWQASSAFSSQRISAVF